jgi:hypothetical protein
MGPTVMVTDIMGIESHQPLAPSSSTTPRRQHSNDRCLDVSQHWGTIVR